MCKLNKSIEKHRKKLEGIINTKNLTDEQILNESHELDKILNKQSYKCSDCNKPCKHMQAILRQKNDTEQD